MIADSWADRPTRSRQDAISDHCAVIPEFGLRIIRASGLRPVRAIQAHALFEVAVAGQEVESRLDEGLRIERDEIGLVAVDALVVSGVERAGFFWLEREIAEALPGTHFPWAQDQVIGLHGADRVAVLGEGELDGGQGVTGFEPADFGLAESVKFLEGQGAGAAAGGEIGRERGDAFEEVLCSGIEIEDHRFLRLRATRFGKGAPGSGLFRCGFGHKERSLERLILGVTGPFGGLMRLEGVLIPKDCIGMFPGGCSVGIAG
jgi:hypothetical protein